MRLRRIELLLAACLTVQLFFLWVLRPSPPEPPQVYFQAAALSEGALSAIELTNPQGSVRFIRDPASRWRLGAPLDSRVDEASLGSLIGSFHRPIEATIRLVDSPTPSDLLQYGLGPEQRIHFRAESGEDVALELWVGTEQGNGMTCFQARQGGPILLARLPARFRLERPPGAWRNRLLVPFATGSVLQFRATGPAGTLALNRQQDGRWSGGPEMRDGWTPDQRDINQLLDLLGSLEARDIEPLGEDLSEPTLVVELSLEDQQPLVFSFGRLGGATVPVRVSNRPETFHVPTGIVRQLNRTPNSLTDRQILSFALSDLRALRGRANSQEPWQELRPGPDFGVDPTDWVSPDAGRAVDGQMARFAARTASNLRAMAAPRLEQPLPDPREQDGPQLVVVLAGDRTDELWLGAEPARGRVTAAKGEDPRVFLIPERVADALLEPFGFE